MVAMLGAFFGWPKMLLAVFLACLAGTAVGLALIRFRGRDLRYALPLGTFLGGAAIAVIFVGDPLLAWYQGFLHG
jgi:leader peptidase (prepilin peptidase)/N-methyltransferase